MYDSIIEAVIDAYEGEDQWAYENEVINQLDNEDNE